MSLTEGVMEQKRIAGAKAAEYIEDGMILGLGTGSTAYYLTEKVSELVLSGMDIKAVPTSKDTEKLAEKFGIPLISIDRVDRIDLAIDGVDEIDPCFNAIKGGGGALFREKIVADMAETVIWIMAENKLVERIGAFPLPVEVLPFGYTYVIRRLKEFSFRPALRMKAGKPYVTDNGNYIMDIPIENTMDIQDIAEKLNSITGIVETGLFLNKCKRIIVGTDQGVRIIENQLHGI